jgi:hypothetical protein
MNSFFIFMTLVFVMYASIFLEQCNCDNDGVVIKKDFEIFFQYLSSRLQDC